tara:strand:+ start:46 stop:1017 length:972 start_codon:yes stop_codon:yes gene_type:complete
MNHISLFSGIGGFDLASEWMGWNNIASCEINPFGRKILNHYWPDALHHDDVHTFTKELLNEKIKDWNSNDVILTGGFPCQPYSVAGKRKGTEDDRHLWPEMLRVIQEIQPRWIVGENVRGLVNWNGGMVFDEVQSNLEAIGYEVQSFILPACSKNAPHRRDRLWIVANSDGANKGNDVGTNERTARKIRGENAGNVSFKLSSVGNVADSQRNEERIKRRGKSEMEWDALHSDGAIKPGEHERRKGKREFDGSNCGIGSAKNWENFPTQSPICGGNDGISRELDGITFPKWRNESIKAYGNAVVPQVVFEIFKTIEKYEQQIKT